MFRCLVQEGHEDLQLRHYAREERIISSTGSFPSKNSTTRQHVTLPLLFSKRVMWDYLMFSLSTFPYMHSIHTYVCMPYKHRLPRVHRQALSQWFSLSIWGPGRDVWTLNWSLISLPCVLQWTLTSAMGLKSVCLSGFLYMGLVNNKLAQVIVITKSAPAFFYFCWSKTIILSIIVWVFFNHGGFGIKTIPLILLQ